MRKLLLDFGNSRMKFALSEGDQVGVVEAVEYSVSEAVGCIEALSGVASFSSVVASSVKGAAFDTEFSTLFSARYNKSPHWASVVSSPRLELAYKDVSRLGVDRYLNMLGAKSLSDAPVLVVSAGTAVTFDGVVGEKHLGGCIFPGRLLLGEALFHSTSLIKARPTGKVPSCFGRSTEDAVSGGVEHGFLGGVVSIIKSMQQTMPADTRVLLTGGDAERLSLALDLPFTVESNLLFCGLLELPS